MKWYWKVKWSRTSSWTSRIMSMMSFFTGWYSSLLTYSKSCITIPPYGHETKSLYNNTDFHFVNRFCLKYSVVMVFIVIIFCILVVPEVIRIVIVQIVSIIVVLCVIRITWLWTTLTFWLVAISTIRAVRATTRWVRVVSWWRVPSWIITIGTTSGVTAIWRFFVARLTASSYKQY